jgi:hypothetical protein
MAYQCQHKYRLLWGLIKWDCHKEAAAFCECFKVFCLRHLAPPAHRCDATTFNPDDPKYRREKYGEFRGSADKP